MHCEKIETLTIISRSSTIMTGLFGEELLAKNKMGFPIQPNDIYITCFTRVYIFQGNGMDGNVNLGKCLIAIHTIFHTIGPHTNKKGNLLKYTT